MDNDAFVSIEAVEGLLRYLHTRGIYIHHIKVGDEDKFVTGRAYAFLVKRQGIVESPSGKFDPTKYGVYDLTEKGLTDAN